MALPVVTMSPSRHPAMRRGGSADHASDSTAPEVHTRRWPASAYIGPDDQTRR
jgi:hypothetical protein